MTVTAGTLGSVLLHVPLYVPPEVIVIEVGLEVGETNTEEEVLIPSQVAVTDEEPTAVPTNSPFPLEDRMDESPTFHVHLDAGIWTGSAFKLNRTALPCTKSTIAG